MIGNLTLSTGPSSGIGIVVWGLGLMEMMLARRMAKLGHVTLQVRVDLPDADDSGLRNDIIDRRGVELNRAAMDFLADRQGVHQFVLMGNCANANIAFNSAVADQRVIGAILTNPHFNGADKTVLATLGLPFRRDFWKKMGSGRVNVLRRMTGVLHVLAGKVMRKSAIELRRVALQSGSYHKGDVLLPMDFDQKIRDLCARGSRVLMVCTRRDESNVYFARTYSGLLEDLRITGQFEHCVLESDAHVFNDDETAAVQRNDAICRWLDLAGHARMRA